MAKRFGGFTPQQQQTLLSKMGYTGPAQQDDINKFMMSSPKASSMMGKYAQMAKARVSGGPQIAMQVGGMSSNTTGGFATGAGQQGSTPQQQGGQFNSMEELMEFQKKNPSANLMGEYQRLQQQTAGQQDQTYTTGQEVFQQGYTGVNERAVGYDYTKPGEQPISGPDYGLPKTDTPGYGQPVIDTPGYTPGYGQPETKPGEQPISGPKWPGDFPGPIIDKPTQPSLYSGDVTNQTLQDIMKMATGATPVDLQYDFNRDGKITSSDALQAAKVGVAGGTVSERADGGGFYDPSQGLPTAPEGLTEADYAPFREQIAGGVEDNIQGINAMLSSNNLPEDPTDYEITGSSGNWTITYADGTTLKSPYNRRASIEAEASNIANVLQQYKESDPYKASVAAQEQYTQKLEQYKSYYGQQSTVAPEQTRANLDTAQSNLSKEQNLLQQYATQLANMGADDPQRDVIQGLIDEQQIKVTNAKAGLSQAQANLERVGMPSTTEMRATALEDPASMATKADVVTATDEQRAAGKIAEGTGEAAATAEQATFTTADTATDVGAFVARDAATYDATTVTDKAKAELERAKAATAAGLSAGSTFLGEQGTVSADALASEVNTVAENRINKVNENVNLEVTKQQLAEAKGKNLKAIESKIAQSDALREAVAATSQVQPEELPPAALIAENQMAQAKAITDAGLSPEANPVAAKMAKFSVDNGTLALAMEGEVKALATVEGQLSQLMKDFDDGTPAWAAGAMRAANAVMASRGLGASSMASAAILQAAMESALPIAQQDANTFAQMGLTNLNNRQQVALSNAAAQQGLELQNLNNEQQANLQRSAQAFALQETNLSNRQSAELANAQIRAALQGQNLNNQQQSNIAVAARYAEQANINLNNKQQASMQTNANQLQTNLANLSSKSQAYITNANLAASLQGQVLSNEQQTSIQNAARYSDAANITFTAQQQNALHNSKMMQTIGLAELDANMAATLQNAATYAGMDMANLNNRQQAAAQNAKAFLELDMTNLNNEQQMAMFKAQATQQALLSDQAADNAAKQFNAASENQTNQFYDNLTTQVAMQNQEQTNAMNRFNAGEENAIEQFNAAQQNARDQFNANNALVVEQANAQWEQAITTMDNAAQNAANRDATLVANNLTETTYNNMLQQERDAMDYAWRSADTIMQLENNYMIAEMQTQANVDMKAGEGTGKLTEKVLEFVLGKF